MTPLIKDIQNTQKSFRQEEEWWLPGFGLGEENGQFLLNGDRV